MGPHPQDRKYHRPDGDAGKFSRKTARIEQRSQDLAGSCGTNGRRQFPAAPYGITLKKQGTRVRYRLWPALMVVLQTSTDATTWRVLPPKGTEKQDKIHSTGPPRDDPPGSWRARQIWRRHIRRSEGREEKGLGWWW